MQFVTQPLAPLIEEKKNDDRNQQIETKSQTIFMIEKAVPPNDFDGMMSPLPNRVDFRKITNNILKSIKFLNKSAESYEFKQNEGLIQEDESKFERWLHYLQLPENIALVSDAFWYSICKFFNPKVYPHLEKQFLARMSQNYISLFLSIEDKIDKDLFFKTYFDTISQGVFYAFFYAFPLSRSKFNDSLKKKLIDEFSQLFTGVEISNTDIYLQDWNLDLGGGNIFKYENQQKIEKKIEFQQQLPPIKLTQTALKARNKRVLQQIKFSPIVMIYLQNNKYRTRNYIQGFKMKFTEVDKNSEETEIKFERYKKLADQIQKQSEQMGQDNKRRKILMKRSIKEIKEETVNHHKRLEKRKAEELERGAHEYANYLVSMLNAGITVANLGVSKQK